MPKTRKYVDSTSTAESDMVSEQSEAETSVLTSDVDFETDQSCVDTDNFSESGTEFYVDTQEETGTETGGVVDQAVSDAAAVQIAKTKRKRKSHLAYKRKYEVKGVQQKRKDSALEGDFKAKGSAVEEGEEEEDVQVDIVSVIDTDFTSNVPVATIKSLLDNLKILLPPSWSTDVIQNKTIRIIHHNNSINASVDSSLYWDCKTCNLGIFVHGIPLSTDHEVFLSKSYPVTENLGSVADYISFMTTKVSKSFVCSGIKNYREFWGEFDGQIDLQSPEFEQCYRSAKCHLILTKQKMTCPSCKEDLEKFKRAASRGKVGVSSHNPDKFLSKEEMKIKKDKWKSRFRKEKRKTERLQKKVEDLQVKLDEKTRDGLYNILVANEHRMTDVQKVFYLSQKDALCAKDKRGLRWHPMMIRIALKLHSISPGAVEFLRDSQIMYLPSDRRLYDYSHFIDPQEGVQGEIIQQVLEKIKSHGSEEHYCYVNLMCDEMHIRSGLVTKKSTGELIGYTNLSYVDADLKKLQCDLENKTFKPQLAKTVLVYLAQGVTSTKLKDVVAIYSTDDLSATQLYDRSWEVIYCLEDAGIKVLCFTCDGASVNRKFINMHCKVDSSSEQIFCTTNLAAGDGRLIYFVVDPPHLVKTIRNALANSFSHRKSRTLWNNGEFLSWKVIEKLYEVTKHDKHRAHKLTKGHILLSSFSCMTVSLATQVLSKSVADSIEELAADETMENLDTKELVKFIRLMNRFFDCVNGKEENGIPPKNSDLASYVQSDDPRLDFLLSEFLGYFQEWKRNVQERPGLFTDAEHARMLITYQALQSLEITVRAIVGAIQYMLDVVGAPFINARVFNQDALEQYFSVMRSMQGYNRNPYLKGVLDSSMKHRALNIDFVASRKGNTEVEKRTLTLDSTPLPSRKKQKK
ncbi:Transposable element P transposase [Frankliniella fusca]|uniref:Transposable element P transposase n=1 Tax=Frankliniella fusca TaxID=407009 RepID=A0AAE1LMG6_9NEOP|nr:Transposable element P transposase [Frankliniella fusca]